MGLVLCEAEKEQIYKDIRQLANDIRPNVTLERKVETFFVPLKTQSG